MTTRIDGTRIEIDGADVGNFLGDSAKAFTLSMEVNGSFLHVTLSHECGDRTSAPLPLMAVCYLHEWTARMGIQFSKEIIAEIERDYAPKG